MTTLDGRTTLARNAALVLAALFLGGTASAHDRDEHHGHDHDSLVVATDKGLVRGVRNAGTRQFLGIPYAAPPTGARRWKAPQPAPAWRGVRDASTFATHCPQPDTAFGRAANSAEDCLYLNIYRPEHGDDLPVMVWIHGGALWLGESEDYDATDLARRGVVVVTINYRLGVFGFLTHPALTAEGHGSSGNYGIMDQQAALKWVKSNIENFGGDRRNVTIFGESAGGHSVHTHLASPLSTGLFHKAIAQSASYSLDNLSLSAAEQRGIAFGSAAGCLTQSAACLRGLTVEQVLANQAAIIGGNGVVTTVDNKVLPRTHREAFATGRIHRVPVIEGSNANEYSLISAFYFDFTTPPAGLGPVTAANYPIAEALTLSFFDAGDKTPAQVDALYPVGSFSAPVRAIDAIGTDSAYSCPARNTVQALSQWTTTYQYEFADPQPPMIFLPDTPSHPAGTWGAYHASELQYLFKVTPSIPSPTPKTAAQERLSSRMIGFWTRFAKTGNPNGHHSHEWPQYSSERDTALLLKPDGITRTRDFAARHKCVFWAGH
jgi:para-nitrobenzyl esterase